MRQRLGLKGFRDFLGDEVRVREKIKEIIKESFERFGFDPLETPVVEREELLAGKYGGDADKLMYIFKDRGGRSLGLRYDLTLPVCRVISDYLDSKISLPYKRYQIQEVFRAEKPQRGRLRQFTQADIDIFGSDSIFSSAEIIACIDYSLKALGFDDYVFYINSRKLVVSLLKSLGFKRMSDIFSILRIIDKLDKKSEEEVRKELELKYKDSAEKIFSEFQNLSEDKRLKDVMEYAVNLGVDRSRLRFSPYLVRGLEYYTDEVFEVKLEGDASIGSLAGGGRYNNLLEKISGRKIPAVGGSIGFERIFEMFSKKKSLLVSKRIFAVVFSDKQRKTLSPIVKTLRDSGLAVYVYLDDDFDIRRQLRFADRQGFDYALFFGEEEKEKNIVKFKEMKSGREIEIEINKISEFIL